ncbi:MAG TPA: hypothetical protein VHG72_21810 [Polyangia bacterium]|nr:hypothetical protein [Polyangia bacterium]
MRTPTKTLAQRVYLLERRAGMRQEGACGANLGGGSSCGKQDGHAERGDEQHVDARDPAFVPWGPDWDWEEGEKR